MKAKNTNKANKMKQVNGLAWKYVNELKISWKDAIKRAYKTIKTTNYVNLAKSASYFEIEFVKVSTGEITKRTASNARIKGTNLLFFSITDNGFRSSIIENIVSVNPITNANLSLVTMA